MSKPSRAKRYVQGKRFNKSAADKRGEKAQPAGLADSGPVLPEALQETSVLTPRHKEYLRDADAVADTASGRTRLMQAVLEDKLVIVSRLLRSGADINAVDHTGKTALHHAAQSASPLMMRLLLLHKPKIDIANKQGETALMLALAQSEVKPFQAYFLLEAGADANLQAKDGNTALHLAIKSPTELFEKVLAASENINCRNTKGITPLMTACAAGATGAVDRLLFYRADLLAASNEGVTSLHLAAQHSDPKTAQRLLEEEAGRQLVNSVNHKGATPLIEAIRKGHAALVRQFLELGAMTNAVDNEGNGALHQAAIQGRIDIMRDLRAAGADLELCGGDIRQTPLMAAVRAGQVRAALVLLGEGANPNTQNHAGISCLMFAMAGEHREIVDALLESGADASLIDDWGRNALHYGEDSVSTSLLKRLIAAGADVNKANKQGETPLMAAIQRYETGYAERLVNEGADVNAATTRGITPLIEAIHRNSRALVAKLLGKGANPNVIEPYYKQTPLMLMTNQGMVDEIKLAIEKGADVNAQDKMGNSALHLVVHAQRNGDAVARMLLSKGGNPLLKDLQQHTPFDYAMTMNARTIVAQYEEHLRKTGQPKYTPKRVNNPYWR